VDRTGSAVTPAVVPEVTKTTDLGVVIASVLSPSHHTREIVLKAHQRANHVLRCFISGDNKLLVKARIYCICTFYPRI